MQRRIEDYALIGDTQSAALVGRDGSIDWLCWPRFDSDACFAALLGRADNGRWSIRPSGELEAVRRRYRGDTLILETDLITRAGTVRVVDFMPPRSDAPLLIRLVEGISGEVDLQIDLRVRFGYGARLPWIEEDGDHLRLMSAPDALALWTDVPLVARDGALVTTVRVGAGDQLSFALGWHAAHERPATRPDPRHALAATEAWWLRWIARCSYEGPWRDAVRRSVITLKALTYAPTGGIVAAPTTSLPEHIGGVRNWDYRYCWIRDAVLTLHALVGAGFLEEASAFRAWLERIARGEPHRLQVVYGVAGERRLTELQLPWLSGFESSVPVRIGNAAKDQFQLDVYGELIACMHEVRSRGLLSQRSAWAIQRALLENLERVWMEPDEGIWEVRGPRRHFTHSKVMVWVAFDRAIGDARRLGFDAPFTRWQALRDLVHAEICARAYDPARNTFTQAYDSTALDASLLLIPLVGFLPPSDSRVRGTVDAIRSRLCRNGLVERYDTTRTDDGLPAGEGVFLACSFWLVDSLHALGEEQAAVASFERLVALRNDVGLLAEQFDPHAQLQLGNFPQAFSHVALVNSALRLGRGARDPVPRR